MRALVLVTATATATATAVLGCAGPGPAAPALAGASGAGAGAGTDTRVAPPPARVAWALSWNGAAIGGAWEHDDGVRFERREQIVVRRGDDLAISELTLTIARGDDGAPATIEVTRWQDGPALHGTARATAGGWRVEVDGEPGLDVPAATPFELALRDGPRTGGFAGPVLLAGWGFAVAELSLRADPADPTRATARLHVGERELVATVRYADDGAIAELAGGDGVVARRARLDRDLRPPTPAEVVDGNAIALAGAVAAPRAIVLPDAAAPAPPARPGQSPRADGWGVDLDAAAPGAVAPAARGPDRTALIAALVRRVADEVIDDLAATAVTAGAARTATHGDCTTHALRFAALAADAGIATRVVTGLRVDGGALVRHRWNLAWTGARWIAVDPTWAEAPAAPALIGLALHGARAAELAAADATAFDGLGATAIAY